MYLRDNATGTYLPLVTDANVAPGTVVRRSDPFRQRDARSQPCRDRLGGRVDGAGLGPGPV